MKSALLYVNTQKASEPKITIFFLENLLRLRECKLGLYIIAEFNYNSQIMEAFSKNTGINFTIK